MASIVTSGEISHVLREGCDALKLAHGIHRLVDELVLDYLLIDVNETPAIFVPEAAK